MGVKMKKSIYIILFNLVLIVNAQETDPALIYERAKNSIIFVFTYDSNNNILGFGSGVVVSDDGIVYTNYHVIDEAHLIELRSQEKIIKEVNIITTSKEADIAILKINKGIFPPLAIAKSTPLIGEVVYAIGNPYGYENTFSSGHVSGIREDNKIQFTAPVSEGSSGGALLNKKGELVGISSSGYLFAQNINFAVPVSEFRKIDFSDYKNERIYEILNMFYDKKSQRTDDKLNELVNELIELTGLNIKTLKIVGEIYSTRENYESAVKYFTNAIELDPYEDEFYTKRAKVYENMKLYDLALDDYTRVIELCPDQYTSYLKRASFFEKIVTDYSRAIEDYRTALSLNPTKKYIQSNIIDCYLKSGDTLKALEEIKGNAYNYRRNCEIYLTCKYYEEAVKCYSNIIEYYSQDIKSYLGRASAYFKLGRYASAINDILIYLDYYQNDVDAITRLAFSYLNIEDYINSERYFMKSLNINTDYPALIGLAVLSYQQKKLKKSLHFFSRALELCPELSRGTRYITKNTQLKDFLNPGLTEKLKEILAITGLEVKYKSEKPVSRRAKSEVKRKKN